tara:strand:- start:1739 stop:2122 length:384 start_codon:yes stop_codon:yes gene_type:complete
MSMMCEVWQHSIDMDDQDLKSIIREIDLGLEISSLSVPRSECLNQLRENLESEVDRFSEMGTISKKILVARPSSLQELAIFASDIHRILIYFVRNVTTKDWKQKMFLQLILGDLLTEIKTQIEDRQL